MKNKILKEIKTLKEIYGNKANGQISVKELKQEAIKWVKFRRETALEEMGFKDSVVDFIKDFFNLTEEDLK